MSFVSPVTDVVIVIYLSDGLEVAWELLLSSWTLLARTGLQLKGPAAESLHGAGRGGRGAVAARAASPVCPANNGRWWSRTCPSRRRASARLAKWLHAPANAFAIETSRSSTSKKRASPSLDALVCPSTASASVSSGLVEHSSDSLLPTTASARSLTVSRSFSKSQQLSPAISRKDTSTELLLRSRSAAKRWAARAELPKARLVGV